MKLDSDDFELFDLPRRQAQDANAIDAKWRALLTQVHPDRFVSEGAAAQRLALQWSVRINEAYRRLKDPLQRAACLCELHGVPIAAEDNTAMPVDFLMQQMQWRESLEAAQDLAQVDALAADVRAVRTRSLDELRASIDERGDYAQAAQQVRSLMFVERFSRDVDQRAEALEQ